MLKFNKEIPATTVDIVVNSITIDLELNQVSFSIKNGTKTESDNIDITTLLSEDGTDFINSLRSILSFLVDTKYNTTTTDSKGDIFKEAEYSLIPDWDSTQEWTTYTLGDRRKNGDKIWELHDVGFSYHEPSGEHGHHGWTFIDDYKV